MLATAAMLGTGNTPRPSTFEAIFVERMAASFAPAFKFALNTVCEHIRVAAPWIQYGDEIYACLRFIVERYFLRSQNASFAESFYGFTRVPAVGPSRMRSRDRTGSLLMLVGLPYVWRKFGTYCERARLDVEMDRALRSSMTEMPVAGGESNVTSLRRLMLMLYPLAHTVSEALVLLSQLSFALKLSVYHSPSFYCLGLKLMRQSSMSVNPLSTVPTALSASSSTSLPSRWRRLKAALSSTLKWSLIAAMISFRMLQYVESQRDSSASRSSGGDSIVGGPAVVGGGTTTLPGEVPSILAPPAPVPTPPGYITGSCMLTRLPLTNPSVTPSGCVFNYLPLMQYVKQHRKCPVTGQPLSVDDVRSLRG